MNRRRLLRRIQQGYLQSIRFRDFVNLVEGFGFRYDHTTGSHQVYRHPAVRETLVLLPEKGEAKPYQVRALMDLVARYNLQLEG
jgi:predicted RNA binding protein YcfA (HicA-like mRNA interferase family)